MGGNDDDPRNDFDRLMGDVGKELANKRKELERVMDELRGQLPNPHDAFEDLRKQQGSDSDRKRGTFERFKGFVDSNFSLFSDGFKNFPSNVKELKLRMQEEREARRVEELDIWRRWTGSDDSPDHIKMQVERASKEDKTEVKAATFLLLKESFERNRHVSPQRILDLYRDDEWSFGSLDQFATPMLSFGGACYYKSETVENLPSTARWGWPVALQQWLSVDWFKRSPYSPVRLEAYPGLDEKGEKWRAAFEDLLLASLDKPMQTTEKIGQRMPYGKPSSTYYGPGLDWMLSLQCRGILPPQLPNLYRHYRNEDGRDWFKPAHTRVVPDLEAITSQRSHCMYPRAEADIKTLMDEVGIQASPMSDEIVQTQFAYTPQSSWQVPDSEAELYDQMQPSLQPIRVMNGNQAEDFELMQEVIESAKEDRDFFSAINRLYEYEAWHCGSDALLDNILVFMHPAEIDALWEQLLVHEKIPMRLDRYRKRLFPHKRWQMAFERGEALGLDVEDWHERGRSISDVEAELDDVENCKVPMSFADYHAQLKVFEQENKRRLIQARQDPRTERALARAEKLGYDFEGWDWASHPLEELEAELDREERYTAARRRSVLAKAAQLGYDFEGWEHEGLPVQELEDELLRMDEYAKRDTKAQNSSRISATTEEKRPDVLSQLTTTETVRLPDGTVTTKVVLKRRFADGREETKESVHTSNEALEVQAMEQANKEEREKQQKGKGWFWT